MSSPVSIGRYYAASSIIHRLDPRVKLVVTVCYMVSCLTVSDTATLALAGALVLLAVLIARVPLARLLNQLKPVVFFLVLTSILNLFFVHTGSAVLQLGPLQIFSGGIWAAALYTLRFLFLLLMGSLLMLTTPPVALTDGAGKLLAPLERLGVPISETMLVLSIALRFVPTLSQDARQIANAQIARGARLDGKRFRDRITAFIPLAVPLFSAAVRHAENLGCAMEARCYTGGAGRTSYHELRLHPRDAAVAGIFLVYLVLLVLI